MGGENFSSIGSRHYLCRGMRRCVASYRGIQVNTVSCLLKPKRRIADQIRSVENNFCKFVVRFELNYTKPATNDAMCPNTFS